MHHLHTIIEKTEMILSHSESHISRLFDFAHTLNNANKLNALLVLQYSNQ